MLEPIITLQSYLSVSMWFIMGFGLIFQTPLVIFLIVLLRIVRPETLSKYRRHAIVGILVVAAALTPTGDPVNLMIMAVPMYILYELGIIVARFFLQSRIDEVVSPSPSQIEPDGGHSDLWDADPKNVLDPDLQATGEIFSNQQ